MESVAHSRQPPHKKITIDASNFPIKTLYMTMSMAARRSSLVAATTTPSRHASRTTGRFLLGFFGTRHHQWGFLWLPKCCLWQLRNLPRLRRPQLLTLLQWLVSQQHFRRRRWWRRKRSLIWMNAVVVLMFALFYRLVMNIWLLHDLLVYQILFLFEFSQFSEDQIYNTRLKWLTCLWFN